MDYAYALSSADTGMGVTEWMSMPIVEMFDWGAVVAERQKQMEKEMKSVTSKQC